MHGWLALLLAAAAPASAQDVQAGIKAWQKGDVGTAVAIWRPLADRGDADARFNLGQAYRLGRGVPVDLADAQVLYEQAARQGHLDAQTSLGLLQFQNGNRTSALKWLKAAADAGEPRALLIYGTALFNGDGVTKDPATAYAMVSRAAAQGLEPAKATLAEMDQLIPLADRQQGVALALQWARTNNQRSAPDAKRVPGGTPPARPAATSPSPSAGTRSGAEGPWRAQLGAFSQRSSAEALFRKLQSSLAGKRPILVPSGTMTRLQVGPYASRAEAAAACKVLMARGQACFPVAAR
jgi:TPR repeat protein